jgi:hypothetical protein
MSAALALAYPNRIGQSVYLDGAWDWLAWHRAYDDPASPLSRRLRVVQREIARALDSLPPGQLRVLSLCAGDGRDLITVLAHHRRRDDVSAVLVELDPRLVEAARSRAYDAGLHDSIDVRHHDAGLLAAFDDALPVDMLLLCGIFGNVSELDIRATIESAASGLVVAGGIVIWTRGAKEPDLRPMIRSYFQDCGFEEVLFEGEPHGFGVGVDRLITPPSTRSSRSDRIFAFAT